MPRTSLADAETAAKLLCTSVTAKRLRRRSTNETLGGVTLSVGLACFRSGEHAGDFFKRTDAGLYASKYGGRDRITSDQAGTQSRVA